MMTEQEQEQVNAMMAKMDKQALKILNQMERKKFGLLECLYTITTMLNVLYMGGQGNKDCQEIFDLHLAMWQEELTKFRNGFPETEKKGN